MGAISESLVIDGWAERYHSVVREYLGGGQTMEDGPDIAQVATCFGEPARVKILLALMSGMAPTASELSREAGVTPGKTYPGS